MASSPSLTSKNNPEEKPRPNITMTANGAYTAVNHKITIVNGPYFTRLASTVLRPFVDGSYTIKNALKIEYLIVYDTTKYGRNTVDAKRAKLGVCRITFF
jgi:type V secretory pathway adhesin AidA